MKKILSILGDDHTNTASFRLSNGKYIGVYTYENGVYVITEGRDISFDELSEDDQKEAIEIIESGKYDIRNDMQ